MAASASRYATLDFRSPPFCAVRADPSNVPDMLQLPENVTPELPLKVTTVAAVKRKVTPDPALQLRPARF